MASKELIKNMIAATKTLYSYYAKDTDIKTLVNLWGMTLQEFPDDITEKAFLKALQTCKMPPTPADVIENIKTLARANEPTDEELWSVFTKALKDVAREDFRVRFPITTAADHRKNITKIFEGLPDKVKQYVGSRGELIRLSQYDENSLKFVKTDFMKTMPAIQTRIESSGLMLDSKSNKLLLDK